jgi:hypothetical protein
MALKACTVVIHDLNETARALDVTAATLYEAVAQALAALSAQDWVGRDRKGPDDCYREGQAAGSYAHR